MHYRSNANGHHCRFSLSFILHWMKPVWDDVGFRILIPMCYATLRWNTGSSCLPNSVHGWIYTCFLLQRIAAAKQGMRAAFSFLLSKTPWELCGQENPAQSQQTSRSQTCVCTCKPACNARLSTVPTRTCFWVCTSTSIQTTTHQQPV